MSKRRTQEDAVMQYLQAHGSITSIEAFSLGITRLSAVIFRLKEAGVNIHTQIEYFEGGTYGTSRYARYYKF